MDLYCKLLWLFEGVELFPVSYLKKDYKETLEEIAFQKLINDTDEGRLERANMVRTSPPRVTKDYPNDYHLVEFNFKSKNSTTGQRARGYAIVNKAGDLKECHCTCKDWFYRLWWVAVKHKIARWNIPSRFRNPKLPLPNRKPPVQTNPEGKLYVCKHIAALKNYLSEK